MSETCPECGDTFDSEHGVSVHMGMVHSDETVRTTPRELRLAVTGRLLETALAQLTGLDSQEDWADGVKSDDLDRLIEDKAATLAVETQESTEEIRYIQ